MPLLHQPGRLDCWPLGGSGKPHPGTVSCWADSERVQRRRAACEFERRRLRIYFASSSAGSLRRQGPAELADNSAIRVSADNRALPAFLRVLPHSDVYSYPGWTCNSRLSRNRTASSRRHYTLARPWDRGAEEALEKQLHHARLGD